MEALKQFFFDNYLIIIIAGAIFLMVLVAVILYFRMKKLGQQMNYRNTDISKKLKDGNSFEDYCAELLTDNGFTNVHLTPQSRDFGVDITAEKAGVSYAFQCKYYNHPVGTRAVQEIYAGVNFYHRMVGVVLTNENFTSTAVKLANELNILLWGDEVMDKLEKMES